MESFLSGTNECNDVYPIRVQLRVCQQREKKKLSSIECLYQANDAETVVPPEFGRGNAS